MNHGLSGYTIALNCVELDYPLFECIASMLPICDEVVVSDAGSSDGTVELLRELAKRQPKVRLVHHPEILWEDGEQVGNNWVNAVRQELRFDMQFWMDADEILDPNSFAEMRRAVDAKESRIFNYINFWLDAQHTTQWGDGKKIHLQPTSQFMYVHGRVPPDMHDYSRPMDARGQLAVKGHESLITYHYSALRKPAAYIAKCKQVALRHGGYSERDHQAFVDYFEQHGEFMNFHPDRVREAKPFTGRHPQLMHRWLLSRGWKVDA